MVVEFTFRAGKPGVITMSKELEGTGPAVNGDNMEQNAPMNANHVEVLLNYLEYTGERPAIYLYEPTRGVPIRSRNTVKRTIRVYDGRQVADHLTLDKQGFAFMRHESEVVNFYDPDEVGGLLSRGGSTRQASDRSRSCSSL
jgi:hypothetical protein